MEQTRIQPRSTHVGTELTDEDVRRLQGVLRECGQPAISAAHLRLTFARLLRFYHLCETAGRVPRPPSRIHRAVDDSPLAGFRRLIN